MPRSSDLDNVAPDDNFNQPASQPSPSSSPVAKSPKKHLKKSKPTSTTLPLQTSANTDHRQKIYETLGRTSHPFSSFLVRPKVFTFEERDEHEEIILVLRQHWFSNVKWILTAIFMALLPSLLTFAPIFDSLQLNYRLVAVLFWYLLTFAYAFEKFLSWYFNVYIITDERVIDIDFNNLLSKRFSEAKLNAIQDITSQVTGLFQTMFNYGIIYIQTAGEVPEIQFENCPNPQKVIKLLQQLRQEEEQEALEGRVR